MKKIIALVFGILLFPVSALAAEWGVGLNQNGGISVGVGSSSLTASAAMSGGIMSGGGWVLSNPYGLPQGSILGIASNLLFWLLAIFAILGVVGFVIAGIIYLVSTGDDTMITRAKTAMNYSIIGIVVGLSGFLIMQAVSMLLSGGSSSF
jgi:hypothetical protein